MANVSGKQTQKTSIWSVGRTQELRLLRAALLSGRHVLLEGPVGAGKTHLALTITGELERPVFRIDGDQRYSEQKLSGWFDPPTVIEKGYSRASFLPGPLVQAMEEGGVLFINELNRLPEGVQNVLLPAIDERLIQVPRLGEIRAKPGFVVVATQNPKEFVATSHLSEAILDRFELITIDYQTEEDEREIVANRLVSLAVKPPQGDEWTHLARLSVSLARLTRSEPRVRRGASVRAAIAVAELAVALGAEGMAAFDAFLAAARMSLPTRIEVERDAETESVASASQHLQQRIADWVVRVWSAEGLSLPASHEALKKKS